jgi:hypothetical protein
VDSATLPSSLDGWTMSATRALPFGKRNDSAACALRLAFVTSSGELDTSCIVYDWPAAMGLDATVLVHRTVGAKRQYALVALQSKTQASSSVRDSLRTLHPGCQYLPNGARDVVLRLTPGGTVAEPAAAAWDDWRALDMEPAYQCLTRNWIRVAVVARQVHGDVLRFSYDIAEGKADAMPAAWTTAHCSAAYGSPIVWVSLARTQTGPSDFPESVRAALVGTTNTGATLNLCNSDLWVPASIQDAAAALAACRKSARRLGPDSDSMDSQAQPAAKRARQ